MEQRNDTGRRRTSWQAVSAWYDASLGASGDRTHADVVIPKSLALLSLSAGDALLDLGCGQGILGRSIPQGVRYVGIDIAPSLVSAARNRDTGTQHVYAVGDITKDISVEPGSFSHAACILALDNLEHPETAVANAARALRTGGTFVFVINHPCFRIPRQSSWEVDTANKIQYRRLNRYLSPLKIPITMHPGKGGASPVTWTFHHPLSVWTSYVTKSGCSIDAIEEWVSTKTSVGPAASMENRARAEFPMFLAVKAVKR